jgi:hypothetical protein
LGAIIHDDQVITDEEEQAKVVAAHWGRVFSWKPINESRAVEIAGTMQKPLQLHLFPPPSSDTIERVIVCGSSLRPWT